MIHWYTPKIHHGNLTLMSKFCLHLLRKILDHDFFLGGSGGKAKEKKNTWHGSVSGTKRWRFKKICPGPPVSSSIFWFQSCRWKGDSWHVRLHNMCCITCPSLKQTTSSYSCWFLCWDYLQISNVPDKDLFVVDIFSWTWSFFTSFTLKN